jgi:hypothetical protein
VFAAVLGITRSDWRYLRGQLLDGVRLADSTQHASTDWGDLYETVIVVAGRGGQVHRVRVGWVIRPDDPRPHLVTAYVDLS